MACDVERVKRYQARNPDMVKKARKARYWKDPEAAKAKVQKYRDENRESVRKRGRELYQRPETKEYQRQYREAHKERRNKLISKWSKNNRDRRRESNQRWYYSDVERSRMVHLEKVHRRRAKKLEAEGSHTKEELAALLDRQACRCAYCRADLRKVSKHADHIVPLSEGGSDAIENIQYLCAPCNLSKGAKDPYEFAQERGLLL
tara:strand:+ start:7963 stop:8574 length:612 start_codon:yes stop_codon:yes gene_type:complete